MADNKNQHYVPRCFLKPFSLNGEGKAINLYNHPSGRGVQDAPVKTQCSHPYFYGEDLVLEKLLQQIEGPYGDIVSRVQKDPTSISEGDLRKLRDFAYLQVNRTKFSVHRRRSVMEAMDEISMRGFRDREGVKLPEVDLSHRNMLLGAIKTWAETAKYTHDLRTMILRNDTDADFIASDHPAILLNRLHQQRLADPAFGLMSCGVQLFMPISPKHALVAYDADIYAAPGRSGAWMPVRRKADVAAINQLQHLSCMSNLFFARWTDLECVRAEFAASAERRPKEWTRFWVGVEVGTSERGEEYRRATPEEIASPVTKVISHSQVHPLPSAWFSGLTFKPRMYGYTNGSAGGLVRLPHAKNHFKDRFWRIPATRGACTKISDDPQTAYIKARAS